MLHKFIADLATQVPEIPTDSIVSRSIHQDDNLKVILFAFAAGQELSEHTSPQIATLHFIQGEADLTLGEEKLSAQAGTWAYMPPKLPHSIKAKTSVLMLLMMFKNSG